MDTDLNPGCSISSAIPPTPATNAPGKAVRNSPSVWAHEPIQKSLLASGFCLVQPCLLQPFGEWNSRQQTSLSLPLFPCNSAFQTDRTKKKKKRTYKVQINDWRVAYPFCNQRLFFYLPVAFNPPLLFSVCQYLKFANFDVFKVV